MNYIQYTVEIETKNGYLDYLIISLPTKEKLTEEIIKEEFNLYKNDEAGEHLKNDKLVSYVLIRKD